MSRSGNVTLSMPLQHVPVLLAGCNRQMGEEGSEVFSFQHLYLYIKVPFMNTHCVGRPFINSIMAPNHPPNCKNINFYLLNSIVVYFLLFCGLRSVKECKGITLVCTGTRPKQALPQLCFLCLVRHSRWRRVLLSYLDCGSRESNMHRPAASEGLRPLFMTSFVLLVQLVSAVETCMRRICDKRKPVMNV